jgi:hypothetical protein
VTKSINNHDKKARVMLQDSMSVAGLRHTGSRPGSDAIFHDPTGIWGHEKFTAPT